jgi:protein-disulfide isomerase
MKTEIKVVIGIGIVVVGLGVLLFTQGGGTGGGTASGKVEAGRNSTGSTAAKVQVIEFGDFQCPACGQAEPVVESFIAKYKGNKDVNFSFRNFPLPQHQYANQSRNINCGF